jgi:tetratricopeptide (TPR) repeat protein
MMRSPIPLRVMAVFGLATSLLFVSFVSAQGPTKKDQKEAKKLTEQAKKAFDQRNYRNAVDTYKQALMLVPTNAESHFRKGYSHYVLKENDLALAEFELALNQGYAKPLEIYSIRWGLYNEKKDFAAALVDIQKVLAAQPTNTEALIALGDINYSKGAYRDAIDAYQKAAPKATNPGDLFYWIAKSYSALGDVNGQASAAGQAIGKGTKHLGDAYYLMGDANQKLRKYTEALDAYNRALAANPATYDVYGRMAEMYRSQGKFNDAIEISKRGLRAFPNDGNFYTDLSLYYSLADRPDDAVQAGLAGTKLLPDKPLAYTNLCRAYNDVNKPDLAVSACNSALRLNPNDGETYFYLGRAHDLAGRDEEATKYYRRAVTSLSEYTKNKPDSADGFYLLGNAYFADKQREKAVDAYLKALSLSPGFARARYNTGIIYALQKNKNGALEQYNQLLTIDPALAAKLKVEIDKL